MSTNNNTNVFSLVTCLWSHFSARRKQQFLLLLIIVVLASFAEIVSLGAVIPFISVIMSPETLFQNPKTGPLIQFLGLTRPDQLLLPLTIGFASAILIASSIRLLMVWATTKLSFATGADISLEIYKRTLHQPYSVHISRNSSEIIDGISLKSNTVIYNVILPLLTLTSASIMLLAILIALTYMNPLVSISALLGFGAIYLFIILITKKSLLRDSEKIATESVNLIKSLQEGLGGIRDILLDSSQDVYCGIYQSSDRALRKAQGNNYFISQSPRYIMEALGMILIACLAYTLAQDKSISTSALPTLGAFALGAQRLLPVLQQSYSSWTNIRSASASFKEVVSLLEQPFNPIESEGLIDDITFKEKLTLKNVSFKYDNTSDYVFKDLILQIKKGERIGFIGETGSGKSTLLDLIMCLLDCTKGHIEIDGVAITDKNKHIWQKKVAHVPQSIFLTDNTIEENIAFGCKKNVIDANRVRQAAKHAQIDNFIESLPDGYNTHVGERGVRLSGGQRQRIGIARALYKKSEIIIFDEATSALDNKTEVEVMDSIEKLSPNLTILIIAHRLSTLKKCSTFIKVKDGTIQTFNQFSEISA